MKEIAIGIDIGGTNTKIGLVDREGNILYQDSISTMADGNVNDFIKFLKEKLTVILSSHSDITIKGVGIGAPNANYYKGTIEYAPNIRWGEYIRFKEAFSQQFDYPMVLTNDANAAALGEMVYGNARGMSDFVLITLGTGLGSGIVVNGNVVYGHDGFAGELGHVNVKLADTVLHTSPEAIFLFGGLVKAGDYLLTPTKKYMEESIFKMFKNKVKLLASGLMDRNAAVLGASALVWKEFE
ncbi:MAG: ROK family protein [Bacteroidetes bacterium]|nr:ROK family protein [Bacteroidota bacterium]MDA1119920.1 ROK family protein [Bacteroidota bacterium]